VTAPSETLGQIEYRWHDVLDLSPFVSTMPSESLRDWDLLVRPWVRHPHLDGLGESVCYQVLPAGRAALAWRYENDAGAEREDGTPGRPLFSRVLVGKSSLLTPELAIALTRAGLPEAAGPPPGQVEKGGVLPTIAVADLAATASLIADMLDQQAAEQAESLRPIIVEALRQPGIPLGISLGNPHILCSPMAGQQCALLWGLWRIGGYLLGPASRAWSFSTFEPPLGDADPATLPDVVFRQVKSTSLAPARTRIEAKLRLSEPIQLDEQDFFVDLVTGLLAEYRAGGAERLRRLITASSGSEYPQSALLVGTRLSAIHAALRSASPRAARPNVRPAQAPQVTINPMESPDHGYPVPTGTAADGQERPGYGHPAPPGPSLRRVVAEPEPPAYHALPPYSTSDPELPAQLESPDRQVEVPVRGKHHAGSGGSAAVAAPSGEGRSDVRQARSAADDAAPRRGQPVSEVLKKLSRAKDSAEFQSWLKLIHDPEQSPAYDRVKSRREVAKPDWYRRVCDLYDNDDAIITPVLAEIFSVIVIPDLDDDEVMTKTAEWADTFPVPMVGGLLEAAGESGKWQKMMSHLALRLAYRWLSENQLVDVAAYSAQEQPVRESVRSRITRLTGRS
jgi:hypothetical protein